MMERIGAMKLYLMKWICLRWAWVCLAACGGKVELHSERRGVIYSPSWPLNYPPGVNCSWNIQGNRGDVITISFHSFDLEDTRDCRGDWLLLGPTWKTEYRICGSVLPPPFISSRGRVWVFFHSQTNSSGLAQGFRMSYIRGRLGQSSCENDEYLCGNGKCVPRSWRCNGLDECGDNTDERSCAPQPTPARVSLCPPGTLECSDIQSTRCLPASLRCNGARDCPDGSDEARCPDTSCGKHLVNFYGTFASPDFFHPNRSGGTDLHCTWFLDTQGTLNIQNEPHGLIVKHFAVPQSLRSAGHNSLPKPKTSTFLLQRKKKAIRVWKDTRDPKPLVLQVDLQLGVGDLVRVYDGLGERPDRLLQSLSHHNNHRRALLESSQGQMSVFYHAKPHSPGHGFNATYQVKGYCFPGEHPCGTDEGCYTDLQRCDGYWHCPAGRDEEHCPLCQAGEYPCEGGGGTCYSASERCNNQKKCPDGSDEKNCFDCQPGNFHCGTNLCIFETWRCDGQEDCLDGSDERDCLASVPRKVITAALIGSLVCGLLLVIALGCAFKLYSLRTREYRAFETQMTRLEAEFVQREAPPSYGQLIAQGLIPPVDDFPVYNPTQASVLQNLRSAMRRQIRRHSSRRSSSRRRLGRLWNRLFHRGSRLRGQIPLLTPPGHTHLNTHTVLGLHSYNTVDCNAEEPQEGLGQTPSPCSTAALGLALQAHTDALCLAERESPPSSFSPTSPASPRSSSDTLEDEDEEDDDDGSSELSRMRIRSKRSTEGLSPKHKDGDSPPGPSDRPKHSMNRSRTSRRLVQELAAELRGVSILRYTSIGVSPLTSPESPTSSSGQSEEHRGLSTLTKPHMDTQTGSHSDVLLSPGQTPLGDSRNSSGTEDTPGDPLRHCRLTSNEEEIDDVQFTVH